MKQIFVFTESDEYGTLRNEMLTLFTHARQLLYWTTGFVIAGMGWYVSQESAPKMIPTWLFTLFLFLILAVSGSAYAVNTNQVYRIGGFLAVFWESNNPEHHRIWHRFNRRGPSGGFLPNVATTVYTTDAIIVLLFFTAVTVMDPTRLGSMAIPTLAWGSAEIMLFLQLGLYLRNKRGGYEIAWREIKESPERMAQVHDRYETIPSRIVLP